MGCSSVVVVLMIILASYVIHTSSTGIEIEALKAFKSLIHLHPSNITLLSDWTDETHHCNWSGIACHPFSNLVASICLHGNQLSGKISPYLGNLSSLQILNLGSNSFYASTPMELGFLTNLRVLDLGLNLLNGSIPETISNCTSLSKIDLSSNRLTGTIPSSVDKLTSLQIFAAYDNDLVGNIPVSFGKLEFLEILDLSRNKLVGSLAFELGNLVKLQILQLDNNKLSSVIPYFQQCESLLRLGLSENEFSGQIPPQLGLLKSLKSLNLHSNFLSGSIPEEIGGLEMVEAIDISNNNLSGSIPLSLGRCRNLILLDISGNRLSNGIPADVFSEMDLLTSLNLSGNVLDGQLPIGLQKLQHLHSLDLSCNRLSGRIPNNFTNFISLRYLNLSFNQLEGPLPIVGVFQNLSGNLALGGTNIFRPSDEIGQSTDPRGFLLFVCTVLTCGSCFRKHRRISSGEYEEPRGYVNSILKKFSQNDLEVATDSFHQRNLIDQRELCTIYMGIVLSRAWNEYADTHKVVAVKRWDLLGYSTESDNCFLRELGISNLLLRHRNLVKLIGYSFTSGFKAIVLDYMENGSLESIIHDPNTNKSRWTFSERLRVCVYVANALVYMHSECGDPVVHFNLKPSNVLFDGDWEAHLSNFGTSRMLGINVPDGSSGSTSASQGGPSYLAPEFRHTNTATTKADVYSFGMLVLEFITMRRPTETIVDDEFPNPVTLHEFVNGGIGKVLQLVDPDFATSVSVQQEEDRVMDLLKLALSCTRLVPDNRPEMTEVLLILVKLRAH